MAQVEFGTYDKKTSKIVLIGSNHRYMTINYNVETLHMTFLMCFFLPPQLFSSLPFAQFATVEAIQCMEVYEYVQSLANPHYYLPHLQVRFLHNFIQ